MRRAGYAPLLLLAAQQLIGCGARSSLDPREERELTVIDGSFTPTEPSRPGRQLTREPPSPVETPPGVTPSLPSTGVSPTPQVTAPPDITPPPDVTVPPPNTSVPSPNAAWASCGNPMTPNFPASGGTYTSFSHDATDTVVTGCGVGRDVVFSWTSLEDGYYAFSAPNTEYDVTIALLADSSDCTASLACSRGLVGGDIAYVEQYAQAGETFLVAVEGQQVGRFSLSIEPLELPRLCNPVELPSEFSVAVSGDFALDSRANAFGSYCNSGRRSATFTYTAPCTGVFRFTAPVTSFDTVLIAAQDCEATNHSCNDDYPLGNGSAAQLDLQLTVGQRIILFLAADRDVEFDIGPEGPRYELEVATLQCEQ